MRSRFILSGLDFQSGPHDGVLLLPLGDSLSWTLREDHPQTKVCNHFTIGLKYKRMVRGMKCVVQLPQGNNSKREKRKSMKEREGKTIAIRGTK